MDVEILALEKTEEASLVARVAIADADDGCGLGAEHFCIESFNFFLILCWQM